MNRHYSLLLVIVASLLFSIIHCPLFEIFFDDKEIFKYTGYIISRGGVPYRDFFDHKPPLIFFFNYFGPWGLWIIDSMLVLLASLVLYRLCKRYKIAYPWIIPLIFNLLIRNQHVSLGTGMTRAYTAIFLVIFFCVMLSRFNYRYLIMGCLSAMIFFMQQDQVIPLLPFLIYALFMDTPGLSAALLRRSLTMLAGFLLITFPVILYFQLNHSLVYFWEDAFLFNFNWYTEKKPLLQHIRIIRNELHNCEYDVAFYGIFILGIASLLLGNKRKKLLLAALSAVLLSFCSELLSGKLIDGLSVIYYFLPLSATLPILLFVVMAFTDRLFASNKYHIAIYGCILSFQLFFHILQYAVNLHVNNPPPPATSEEFALLSKEDLHDNDLYVFYNSSYVYLYNRFNIKAPSKWIYHYFWHWYADWDADQRILHSIAGDLLHHKTRYVLDYSDKNTFRNKNNEIYWKSFLKNYYVPALLPAGNDTILWKLKTP